MPREMNLLNRKEKRKDEISFTKAINAYRN